MKVTRERTAEGVTERLFELTVAGNLVPGVLWTPEGAEGPRPLVLQGHGYSQHKKIGPLAARGRYWAGRLGWAVAAIDAPDHGSRVSREASVALARDVMGRIEGKGPVWNAQRLEAANRRARQIVPEWKAVLDALQGLEFVGAGGPVGYWGVSMGTMLGMPFVAAEPRIGCAVFGLAGVREGADFVAAARRITIPVEFVFQWDDELVTREDGTGLFDALGSKDKAMHVNPGGHLGIPSHEAASWTRFFRRRFGIGGPEPAAGNFDFEGFRRAFEGQDVEAWADFFAEGAEWLEYRDAHPPRAPAVRRGRDEIAAFLAKVKAGGVKLAISEVLAGGDAFSFRVDLTLPDGRRVLEHVRLETAAGKIVRQVDVEAWDPPK